MFCCVKTVVSAVNKDPLLQGMVGEEVPDVLAGTSAKLPNGLVYLQQDLVSDGSFM